MKTQTLTAVLHREGEWFVADCPELGTVSRGATAEEALENLREASELFLEEFPSANIVQPVITTFEAHYA